MRDCLLHLNKQEGGRISHSLIQGMKKKKKGKGIYEAPLALLMRFLDISHQ